MKRVMLILMWMVAVFFCGLWAGELVYGDDIFNEYGDVIAQTLESHYDYGHYADLAKVAEAPEPTKPYLHKNPDNDHWICSKHGDLMPDYIKGEVYFDNSRITFYETMYCHECYWRTINTLVNQHITGVRDNE